MPALEARGVELGWEQAGRGPPALLVHETGTGSAPWRPLAAELAERGMRAITYDRRGWGASGAPQGYARTTVEEQSEDAAALLEVVADGPTLAVGAGLGAVIALDLLLRHPALVSGAMLIEPPVLALVREATQLLSEDRETVESVAGEGPDALAELYLSGRLAGLAPGVARVPRGAMAAGRERPVSLIAEIGAAPGWAMPVPRLAQAERPSLIVQAADTPAVLLQVAERLADRLAGAELRAVDGPGPPHLMSPAETALLAPL